MIIDHNNLMYRKKWEHAGEHKFNGAYYYSREIVKNIIPNVKTDRNWVTISAAVPYVNHAIVFVHDNLTPEVSLRWLGHSRDLILVCGIEKTLSKVKHLGTPIYLPLSVDVEYVKQFKTDKTKDTAYVGRPGKPGTEKLPKNVNYLSGMNREMLLREMAKYQKVYAVGRCAIEAKILGCEVLPYDPRYPDPSVWEILDNKDAAKMLQDVLDRIDFRSGGANNQGIIDTTNPLFIYKNQALKSGRFNGAYYYSQEIVKNIIPNVKTTRPWDTLTMQSIGTMDGAICFLHQCIDMDDTYAWLKKYKDLILVVSSPYVYDWAIENGYTSIYLPLSIDVEYVKKFKKKKRTKNACFCGNIWKFREQEISETIPDGVDFQPPNICREDLLRFMSDYKYVYAIGRCALEAQVLGAKILQCYKKFPVEHWKVLDNKDAAKILQEELGKIDKKGEKNDD